MNLYVIPKCLSKASIFFLTLLVFLNVQTLAQKAAKPNIPLKVSTLQGNEINLPRFIRVDSIKNYTKALSADEMEGRGTMQKGGDKAANWIAEQYKKLGLKPLGDDNGYFQSIDFNEVSPTTKMNFIIGNKTLVHGKDFGFYPQNNGNRNVSGEMIFVGYGIKSEAIKRNDLGGINVKDKIVVMLDGPPANIKQDDWRKSADFRNTRINLVRAGAKAIIYIGHGREIFSPEDFIDYFSRRQVSMGKPRSFPNWVPPFAYLSADIAKELFAKTNVNYKNALKLAETDQFKAFELKQTASFVTNYEESKGKSSNVIGYIEGSDPKLKKEAVVFTAHYDAFGIENGKIYNGAADNALGTAEMLAVAEGFIKMNLKPKRSLIFLAVTGEEYDLYGSRYWANNPTWDITKISANLNLDGIGTEIYAPVKNFVGYGAEFSSLGQTLKDITSAYGLKVIPDPLPEERGFYRSDHYSFVEKGIPSLMLMGGPDVSKEAFIKQIKTWEKSHYHQATDDVTNKWHWEGAKTVADIMGIMGYRLANQEKMPNWLKTKRFANLKRGNTKPLPEEN